MPNRKPFSHDEFPDLTKAISEVVNPSPRPLPSKKTDQPQKPKGRVVHMDGWRGKSDGKRRRIDGTVAESHTRAQLEKLSITRLRELLKQYTGKPGSGRELADIRGLLRAKGAGSVLDEGFAADERKAARSARVRKWMGRLKKANAADLKEYPGKKGEAAHKRLHKTIAGVVGESMTPAEIGKALEPSRAAQRPKIRAAMKAKLKAKHGDTKGNADERMGRNTQRYKSGPTQGWTGD